MRIAASLGAGSLGGTKKDSRSAVFARGRLAGRAASARRTGFFAALAVGRRSATRLDFASAGFGAAAFYRARRAFCSMRHCSSPF